jgi:hypothetical protein
MATSRQSCLRIRNGQTMTTASYISHVRNSGVSVSERIGVVRRRTEYAVTRTVPLNAPLAGIADVQRVIFLVELHGGLGSETVAIDQSVDATSALIREGDQVNVMLVDDIHIGSTVSPFFAWKEPTDVSTDAIAGGETLRTAEFIASDGVPSIASLVLVKGERDLIVFVKPVDAESAASVRRHARPIEFCERVGVIKRRLEYTRGPQSSVQSSMLHDCSGRVVFLVELHGGLGPELVAVDQTLDAVSTILHAGDQVTVRISGDVHVESTVHPIFSWCSGEFIDPAEIASGILKRFGLFVDTRGNAQVVTLYVTSGAGQVLLVVPFQIGPKALVLSEQRICGGSPEIIVHELGHTYTLL